MKPAVGIFLAAISSLLTASTVLPTCATAADPGRQQILSTAGGNASSPLIDDNLVILEVRLEKYLLDEGMMSYFHNGHILMPLGELCDALELAITVDPANGYASGWVLDNQRRFQLDLHNGTILSQNSATAVPADGAYANDFDIYVDTDLLGQWLPITITTRTVNLYAEITPLEILPVQTRIKRQQARDNQLFSANRFRPNYPLVKAAYQPFTWPLVDLQMEMQNHRKDYTPRFSMQTTGDLAKLTTRTFYTHDPGAETPNTARVRVGRSDNDGGLLGPLDATGYEVGDIYTPGSPLLLRSGAGRGLRLGNQPIYNSATFDVTTIQGDAPPGWDVELQHNSTLLDFTTVDESGSYIFENVPLRVGTNLFLIKLYGPQGQNRQEQRTISIGSDMLRKGDVSYQFDVVQDKRHLFYEMDNPLQELDYGQWTTHTAIGYGLTEDLYVQNSLTRVPVDGQYRNYHALTAGKRLHGTFLRSVLAHELASGYAGQINLLGFYRGRSLQLEHSRYGDYQSQVNDQSTRTAAHSRLGLGGNTRLRGSPLAYDLALYSTQYDSRSIRSMHRSELRVATNHNRYALSSRLDFRHHDTVSGGYTQFSGDQLISTWWGPFLVRGQLRYEVTPDPRIQAVGFSTSWHPLSRLRMSSRLMYNIADQSRTNLQTSLALVLDKFNLSLNTSLSSSEPGFISMMISTSMTGAPDQHRVYMQRSRLSNSFSARTRVFLDRNSNGVFDSQDQPMPGVGIAGNSNWQGRVTDSEGLVFLTGLPAHRGRDIMIDTETLSDPFLISSRDGVNVVGHPGSVANVEFPVTYSGDIEGTVYGETLSGRIPLRNITLELVSLRDYTLTTVKSEYDGYYVFQQVTPGWYEIRIQSESLERKRYKLPPPLSVPISADGGVVTGQDFLLHYEDIKSAAK